MPFKTPDVRVSRGRISRERGGKSTTVPLPGCRQLAENPLAGGTTFRVPSTRRRVLTWNSTEEDKRIRNSRSER